MNFADWAADTAPPPPRKQKRELTDKQKAAYYYIQHLKNRQNAED